jgi:hypothetical protein
VFDLRGTAEIWDARYGTLHSLCNPDAAVDTPSFRSRGPSSQSTPYRRIAIWLSLTVSVADPTLPLASK